MARLKRPAAMERPSPAPRRRRCGSPMASMWPAMRGVCILALYLGPRRRSLRTDARTVSQRDGASAVVVGRRQDKAQRGAPNAGRWAGWAESQDGRRMEVCSFQADLAQAVAEPTQAADALRTFLSV